MHWKDHDYRKDNYFKCKTVPFSCVSKGGIPIRKSLKVVACFVIPVHVCRL